MVNDPNTTEQKEINEAEIEKKGYNYIFIIIGIVLVLIILVGGFLTYKRSNSKQLVGKYELIEMKTDDNEFSKDDFDSLKDLNMTAILELKDDKTGVLEIFGNVKNLTYDDKTITIDDSDSFYYYSDNKLTIEDKGEKLVFEKTE